MADALQLGDLVATGRTSQLYALGADSVVKVPRDEVPDSWLQFEAEMTAAVRGAGVPSPKVRDVVSWNGRIAVVFERINGPSMWEQILEQPATAAAEARNLAAIHTELLATGLPPGPPDLVDRIQKKVATAEALTSAERAQAHDLAAALPHGAALLHGDLHPGNVLLSATGPILIDWFDAAIGHPVADIGRSSMLMEPSTCNTEHAHLPGATPDLLRTIHQHYRDGMAGSLAGRTDLDDWDALVAASRLSEGAHVDESVLVNRWREWSAAA